jgi:DDE superfamily endonuclease
LTGKQIFRQYDRFNEDNFYNYLKHIHYKFPKYYFFLDKAPQHYRSQKAEQYFEKHNDILIPVWLPTASPEFMVLEECWNISKNDLFVCRYYESFTNFTNKISEYFRTKHFLLNMRNYLLANVS